MESPSNNVDPARVARRVAYRKAAQECAELLKAEAPDDSDPVAVADFWAIIREALPVTPRPTVAGRLSAIREQRGRLTDVAHIAAQCDKILDMCSEDICPDFAEFAGSVADKAVSMKRQALEFGSLTQLQIDALDNMEAGLRQWVK